MLQKDEAQAARDKFMSSEGDHITLLNIYRAHKAAKSSKVSFFFLIVIFYRAFLGREVLSLAVSRIYFDACGSGNKMEW